jgi:putative FmdB family regulatory protein
MPLYEYQCDACGHRFEVIQKFSDPPLAACDKCGGAVRKLLSSPAIQFKGSGWYITDYARAGKSDGGGKDKADKSGAKDTAAGATESKGDAKTESKTDSKTDSKSESKPAAPSSS